MYLKTIEVKNFRLLNEVVINIDDSVTLIVGRNNTGKTSLMDVLYKVLNGEKLTFHDYPLSSRNQIYTLLTNYAYQKLSYDKLIEQIPITSVKFIVDYSLETDDQLLGALSPFIIDTDISSTTAIISAEYRIIADQKLLDDIVALSKKEDKNNPAKFTIKKELLRQAVIEHFNGIFSLVISAINPMDSADTQLKSVNELKSLFPLYIIRAERGMDESDSTNSNPLRPILSALFQTNIENTDLHVRKEIEQLREVVKKANKDVQKNTNDILSSIIEKSIDFGYPNAEELQLKANTEISIDNEIKNQTDLTYIENGSLEELPSTYNGLGYKNLIKIEFKLAEFAKLMEENIDVSIPLVFLEEPESHMHPQLQQTFVKYIEQFIRKISNKAIQVFITTHSSHIVNTVPFNKIRYAQKRKSGVRYKDLSDFCATDKENADFIRKYLTLSRCDLFFADRAILIEGAAERLLIPDMMKKCDTLGLFKSKPPKLPSQYYALIEVGGAYAHKFCPFINFLEIPTLILTDIDSMLDGRTKSNVATGKTTSNATIKWWIRQVKGLDEAAPITLKQVVNLAKAKKTKGCCHIEYQTKENGLCGRSLEESIINVNRSIFGIGSTPSEDDIQFRDSKKTDFALKLMIENDTYNIPGYIKDGLIWLNSQRILLD